MSCCWRRRCWRARPSRLRSRRAPSRDGRRLSRLSLFVSRRARPCPTRRRGGRAPQLTAALTASSVRRSAAAPLPLRRGPVTSAWRPSSLLTSPGWWRTTPRRRLGPGCRTGPARRRPGHPQPTQRPRRHRFPPCGVDAGSQRREAARPSARSSIRSSTSSRPTERRSMPSVIPSVARASGVRR